LCSAAGEDDSHSRFNGRAGLSISLWDRYKPSVISAEQPASTYFMHI